MAETKLMCSTHGEFGSHPEMFVENGECRMVERVLSAPGELIDPANVDYEAAMRVMRSWLVEDNDAPLLSAVRLAVDAALGVGETAEGNR